MPLTPGMRLGPYEVGAPLGAGGMGEVYRARDTRLNRDVALKVLPDALASDPERVARFEREAQLLAAVNHPHIAAIYGIEGHAIVLELVDGPTLSERIAAGALSTEETLRIARQVCEALEAAHERGVVHRDLKPGNIKLTHDGDVKVLDFGLAKLLEQHAPDMAMSQSPTFSVHATFAGVILGTAPYMSPEQARGRPVDKRADIWAFGCVLFEMLTGTRAFDGEDVTETLGAVIHKEPLWGALPSNVPTAVRTVLERCLQKDPKQRLRDIGDARIELSRPATIASPASDQAGTPTTRWSKASVAGWLVATVLAFTTGGLSVVHFREQAAAEPLSVRFEMSPPEQTRFASNPVVSPDGRLIAFVVREAGAQTRLWVRSLEALVSYPLPGTENPASIVFWSPDSRSLAFVAAGKLKKVDVSGGTPLTLCDVPGGDTAFFGGAWSPARVLVVSNARSGLWQVPEAGGTASPLTTLDAHDLGHISGEFLPDGRRFLFVRTTTRPEEEGIYLGSLDNAPDQQTAKRLVPGVAAASFVASSNPRIGYLLYVRDTTLLAQRFDTVKLELEGDAISLAEDVPATSRRAFSASPEVLAFGSPVGTAVSHLTWFDRKGRSLGQLGAPAPYRDVDVSWDGKFVAVSQADAQTRASHSWSIDVDRAVFTRVNPGLSADHAPSISNDGRVAFTMPSSASPGDLYWRSASGAGEPALLVQSPTQKHANHWSRDGQFLIYDDHHPTRRQDLWVIALNGDRKPVPVQITPADETLAQFSPNGKWIAYQSDESGRSEIYVRDFAPDRTPAIGAGKWTISRAGGEKVRWSADGKEIYYIAPDRTMMAVAVTIDPTFQPGAPTPLFQTNVIGTLPYDVAPDGRFLVNALPTTASRPAEPITVVLNWQRLINKGR